MSSQGDTLTSQPVNGGRKEDMNTEGWLSLRCTARLMALFTLLPHCLSLSLVPSDFISSLLLSLVSEKNLASRHQQDGYFQILVSHFFGRLVFKMKSHCLPQEVVSPKHWPLSQNELALGHTTVLATHAYTIHRAHPEAETCLLSQLS